jgi:PAS domain S-box-containing protein
MFKIFSNLRVSAKMMVASGFVIFLVLAGAAYSFYNLKTTTGNMQVIVSNGMGQIQRLNEVEVMLNNLRGDLYKLQTFPEEAADIEAAIQQEIDTANSEITDFKTGSLSDVELAALSDFDRVWHNYLLEVSKDIDFVKSGNLALFKAVMKTNGTTSVAWQAVNDNLSALVDVKLADADAITKKANKDLSLSMLLTAILGVASVAGGLGVAWLISLSITNPIKKIKAALARIATGDVTEKVDISSRDEVGQMARSYADMQAYLEEITASAKRIADGDLTVEVTPKSENDTLGTSLSGMVSSLRESISNARTRVEYLNNIPSPVLAMDKEMNVVFVNPAGIKTLGKTEQECLGQKCFDICKTPHCNTAECRIARAMEKDGVFTGDTIASLPSGKLPIRYTGAPLKDASGNIIGALEVITDITEENLAVSQVQEMVSAASEGRLDVRGNPDNFSIVGFRKVIDGINVTLDTVVSPINEVNRVTELIAGGDLTSGVTGSYKGIFGSLKDSVNTMLTNLIMLVKQLKEQADKLSSASEQLSRTSEQAGQATQQIASTSQQVAKGAAEQSTSLHQTTQGIEQLSRAIQQISAGAQEQAKGVERNVEIVNQVSSAVSGVSVNAREASEGARKAGEAAQQGADMTRRTVEGMGKIKQAMDSVSNKITDLGERSNEIGKIVATIDDIAAQTNLLALNAAIEAARAGDQGRGFAVVADEVRKLAERSSNATKEIAELITSIQNGVDQAIKAMSGGNKEVEDGYKLASEAGESLTGILKTVKEVNAQVEKISGAANALSTLSSDMVKVTDSVSSVVQENTAATEEMSASSSEVSRSIETVLGVSEGNNTATQEVSAAAEEMTAQVEEVVASAQTLAQMARGLQENVAAFRLSNEDNRN